MRMMGPIVFLKNPSQLSLPSAPNRDQGRDQALQPNEPKIDARKPAGGDKPARPRLA